MRYKEFNANRVLEKCINLFWDKGYGGCSVKEIVEATGVNRFSLYNEFENKEGILFASLELYNSRYRTVKLKKVLPAKTLTDDLKTLFGEFLLEDTNHPPGCFTIHIATELADHHEKVKKLLNDYTSELQKKFYSILQHHQNGNPQNDFFAKHLVVLFCSSMCHCVIQSKEARINHIDTSIQVLLNKRQEYATHS